MDFYSASSIGDCDFSEVIDFFFSFNYFPSFLHEHVLFSKVVFIFKLIG